ncbi:hypothetical protein FKF78_11845 [Aeromonas hydrophila]|nr:hypothetical protein [Aeromonas hydrophila]
MTIDEDSGEKTGNVIDGVSVDGPVTVQSFSIAGQTGPFVLVRYTPLPVGQLQPGANGRTASPRRTTTTARCRWSPMC